jgi:hypothetical protein
VVLEQVLLAVEVLSRVPNYLLPVSCACLHRLAPSWFLCSCSLQIGPSLSSSCGQHSAKKPSLFWSTHPTTRPARCVHGGGSHEMDFTHLVLFAGEVTPCAVGVTGCPIADAGCWWTAQHKTMHLKSAEDVAHGPASHCMVPCHVCACVRACVRAYLLPAACRSSPDRSCNSLPTCVCSTTAMLCQMKCMNTLCLNPTSTSA